jgi:hypothetical protein
MQGTFSRTQGVALLLLCLILTHVHAWPRTTKYLPSLASHSEILRSDLYALGSQLSYCNAGSKLYNAATESCEKYDFQFSSIKILLEAVRRY